MSSSGVGTKVISGEFPHEWTDNMTSTTDLLSVLSDADVDLISTAVGIADEAPGKAGVYWARELTVAKRLAAEAAALDDLGADEGTSLTDQYVTQLYQHVVFGPDSSSAATTWQSRCQCGWHSEDALSETRAKRDTAAHEKKHDQARELRVKSAWMSVYSLRGVSWTSDGAEVKGSEGETLVDRQKPVGTDTLLGLAESQSEKRERRVAAEMRAAWDLWR